MGFRSCSVCLVWRVLGDSPISGNSGGGGGGNSSSNGNSILIVITIVYNITWVNITFVIVIIINGAVDVGRQPEVIDV